MKIQFEIDVPKDAEETWSYIAYSKPVHGPVSPGWIRYRFTVNFPDPPRVDLGDVGVAEKLEEG